jgi:hypothetical protein
MTQAEKYARELQKLVAEGWTPEGAITLLETYMTDVDKKQEGGNHYKKVPLEYQHWNLVIIHEWTYFQAQAIKYVMRYRDKGGVEDLRKAIHFIEKMIEMEKKEPALTEMSKPAATDYLVHVKPTGWVGFTFEGADGNGFRYRCEHCKEHIIIQEYEPPCNHHQCNEAPPGWRPA